MVTKQGETGWLQNKGKLRLRCLSSRGWPYLGRDRTRSFSPNRRKATRLLRGYEEGVGAPNPEIGLWRTISRNPSLIINTIRWTPVRQFGEKTLDGN